METISTTLIPSTWRPHLFQATTLWAHPSTVVRKPFFPLKKPQRGQKGHACNAASFWVPSPLPSSASFHSISRHRASFLLPISHSDRIHSDQNPPQRPRGDISIYSHNNMAAISHNVPTVREDIASLINTALLTGDRRPLCSIWRNSLLLTTPESQVMLPQKKESGKIKKISQKRQT